jgi:hypothetical protein
MEPDGNGASVHRAAHLMLDQDPKILVGPFARAFTGLLQALASMKINQFPRMRAVITLRAAMSKTDSPAPSLAAFARL